MSSQHDRVFDARKEVSLPQSPCVVGSLNIAISSDPIECRVIIEAMVRALNGGLKSRPHSLAVTKLEEAAMWLNEALRIE